MTIFALLRFAIVMLCIAIAIPANARTNWEQVSPYWLDQTIYQPNCSGADCACDCPSDRSCLPACV